MYDLIIIGGGAGGVTVATEAARVGAKVALIEQGRLGGECTHSACVPSKALIHAANLAHQARSAAHFGIKVEGISVDFHAVMGRIRETISSFAPADADERLRAKGIDVIHGSPTFESYDTIVVNGKTRLSAPKFVIATGSHPAVPEIPGLIETGFLDNRTVWDLNVLPESLLILGGGPVGLELGQAFARLGSKVTILETNDEILSNEDETAASVLRERLTHEGITFFTGVDVTGVGKKNDQTLVKFRKKSSGQSFEALRSHLLVAVGRKANFEGMNLEAAGIHHASAAGIPVDDYLQTESPNIYAIGDVLGFDQATHAAERQASIAVQNTLFKLRKPYRRDSMPRVVFTDPEFASVGVTESVAKANDPECLVYSVDVGEVDRTRISGATGGPAKVVASPSGNILGAVIVGPDASLVIQEFVLAIEHDLSLSDLAATPYVYPTTSGLVRSLASKFGTRRLESGIVRTALRWFYGYNPEGKKETTPDAVEETEPAHHH